MESVSATPVSSTPTPATPSIADSLAQARELSAQLTDMEASGDTTNLTSIQAQLTALSATVATHNRVLKQFEADPPPLPDAVDLKSLHDQNSGLIHALSQRLDAVEDRVNGQTIARVNAEQTQTLPSARDLAYEAAEQVINYACQNCHANSFTRSLVSSGITAITKACSICGGLSKITSKQMLTPGVDPLATLP